jgi:hypothetical protein
MKIDELEFEENEIYGNRKEKKHFDGCFFSINDN